MHRRMLRTRSGTWGGAVLVVGVLLGGLWLWRADAQATSMVDADAPAPESTNVVDRASASGSRAAQTQSSALAQQAGAVVRQQAALAVERALREGVPLDDDAPAEGAGDVLTPSEAMPSPREMRDAFAMLEQQRRSEPPTAPDLNLAEGLLQAIDSAQTPMDRFGLINAYLDAIAGIKDPAQALAARKRLAEVGAAPDALFVGDSSG